MGGWLLRTMVRLKFSLTSRERASRQIAQLRDDYLNLASKVSPKEGTRLVYVSSMPGVDEDMRDWSFFMLLEHNTIVNLSISSIVKSLASGQAFTGPALINPKTDVMPSAHAGPEAVEAFRNSVDEHLAMIGLLAQSMGQGTKRHPVFGDLDPHQWHCMFGFHLWIHRRQARLIALNATL